jgi:hypothetical protein
MSAALDNPIFTDADKAREHLEAQRWPNGAICLIAAMPILRRSPA